MAEPQKVEIGFEGGQVVSVRLAEADLADLRRARERWLARPRTEDGALALYLGKVAFLRIASSDQRVGFSLDE